MINSDITNGVMVITIDRPDKANSLTSAMLEELLRLVTTAPPSVRAVILTGNGKVFSAGADLDEARQGLATSDVWERLSGAIAALPCLTIAALNGTLAGGAFGMVLACDLRVSVSNANFFYPVMKLGFLPQPSDPARMTALIGPARAKMILMGGQKVDADTALQWGLVDRIAEAEELFSSALALTTDAVGATADHVKNIKAMF